VRNAAATPSIDAYLLEEHSCQISSRSNLKDGAFGFFEDVTPTTTTTTTTRKTTTRRAAIRDQSLI